MVCKVLWYLSGIKHSDQKGYYHLLVQCFDGKSWRSFSIIPSVEFYSSSAHTLRRFEVRLVSGVESTSLLPAYPLFITEGYEVSSFLLIMSSSFVRITYHILCCHWLVCSIFGLNDDSTFLDVNNSMPHAHGNLGNSQRRACTQ